MNTFTDAQLIVSREVSDLLDRLGRDGFMPDVREREAFTTLAENGFIVESRAADHKNIEDFFTEFRSGQDQLRVTVLTTLQCNFACDYCIQGDHGEYNKTAAKMSMETAGRVAEWIEGRMDVIAPKSFAMTFFGGEPLLNLPVVYYLAERLSKTCETRGISMVMNVITNGLLLTPEVVDRITRLGLPRRQGHARRRSRHAQPHAPVARRPGHVRQDSQQRPRRSLIAAGSRSAATSTNPRSTATRHSSTSCASRTSPTSSRRSPSSRSSAKPSRSSRRASSPSRRSASKASR